MRGAHLCMSFSAVSALGSPPHARGPHVNSGVDAWNIRITPACAGPTKILNNLYTLLWDHPRMRGAHAFAYASIYAWLGSPPHARGPLYTLMIFAFTCRITPACAGPTSAKKSDGFNPRDHPRMRGAHQPSSGSHTPEQGSPPHARGPQFLILF